MMFVTLLNKLSTTEQGVYDLEHDVMNQVAYHNNNSKMIENYFLETVGNKMYIEVAIFTTDMIELKM